jgi:hypothetical protein
MKWSLWNRPILKEILGKLSRCHIMSNMMPRGSVDEDMMMMEGTGTGTGTGILLPDLLLLCSLLQVRVRL